MLLFCIFRFSLFTFVELPKEWTLSILDPCYRTNLLRLFHQNGSLGSGLLVPGHVAKVLSVNDFLFWDLMGE